MKIYNLAFVLAFVLLSVIGIQESFAEYIPSPRQQLEDGVTSIDILCKENHILVLRTNDKLACVTEKTAENLGLQILETNIIISTQKESSLSSNSTQYSTTGFKDIETKSSENNTLIILENEKIPQVITITLGIAQDIEEIDEENNFELILIISVFLVPIPIIVILFKIWWDS